MSPHSTHHPKCLCCGSLFPPSKRHPRQRFCAKPECRKASKARSQEQWLKAQVDYFCGPVHVGRVRIWRSAHPGYSRGKKRKPAPHEEAPALQDLVPTQAPQSEAVAVHSEPASSPLFPEREACSEEAQAAPATDSREERTLQDLVREQPAALLVGLIAVIRGEALQETFVPFTQRLVERGQRVLADAVHGGGRARAFQTTNNTV